MAKKGNYTKYPLFGKLRSLANLKLKVSDLPSELQENIISWKARKPSPYSWNEETEKTEFGKECLNIANELAEWIDTYVHKKAANEDLKLNAAQQEGEKEVNKDLQKDLGTDTSPNEGNNTALAESREPQQKEESPQILVTASTIKNENNENNETTTEETTPKEAKKCFINQSIKNPIISDAKTEIKLPPKEKITEQKTVDNPLKTDPKKVGIFNETEKKIAQLYAQGVRELTLKEFKKLSLAVYDGDFYALVFRFWSWNYPYTLIKK